MTDINMIIRAANANDFASIYSPAYRQRVRAVGRLAALTYLEAAALPGDVLVDQLADAARAVPGAWAGYPLLHSMEAAGLVTASTSDRAPRRLYEITAAGRAVAAAMRACLATETPGDCLPEYVSAA